MSLHMWNGPEVELGSAGIVAHAMIVLQFVESQASGQFTFVDYVEGGIHGTDSWEALRVPDEEGNAWTVKCTSEDAWPGRDGQQHFTLSLSVNGAIRRFISEKLEQIRTEGRLSEVPKVVPTPMDPYTEECVCNQLSSQYDGGLISWEHLARGRSCPSRLHLCHCGRKWWNYDQIDINAWIEVDDDAAWQDLLTHNGRTTVYAGVMHNKLYTVQTLRNMGFVPVG